MRVLNSKVVGFSTPGTISIMRPMVYGNPFKIGRDGDRETVIAKYKRHFWDRINTDESFLELVLQIQDCDLVCCCAPLPCHGDVIKAWFDAGCPLKE